MNSLTLTLIILGVAVALVAVMMMSLSHGAGLLLMVTRLLPWTRQEILREDRESRDQGYRANPGLDHLVGKRGVLEIDARPTGRARFGDERISVVSDYGLLSRGTTVEGLEVRGSSLVVRAVPDPDS